MFGCFASPVSADSKLRDKTESPATAVALMKSLLFSIFTAFPFVNDLSGCGLVAGFVRIQTLRYSKPVVSAMSTSRTHHPGIVHGTLQLANHTETYIIYSLMRPVHQAIGRTGILGEVVP